MLRLHGHTIRAILVEDTHDVARHYIQLLDFHGRQCPVLRIVVIFITRLILMVIVARRGPPMHSKMPAMQETMMLRVVSVARAQGWGRAPHGVQVFRRSRRMS